MQRNYIHFATLQNSLYVPNTQLPLDYVWLTGPTMQGWQPRQKQTEQGHEAVKFAQAIIDASDPKLVPLPPTAVKPDGRKKYASWRNMLITVITLSVCGKNRGSSTFTLATNKDLINEAQPGLADELLLWRESCKKLLTVEQYNNMAYSKAEAWYMWARRLCDRVCEVSCSWANQSGIHEGIRQAAKIIVGLLWSFSQRILHLADSATAAC